MTAREELVELILKMNAKQLTWFIHKLQPIAANWGNADRLNSITATLPTASQELSKYKEAVSNEGS